MEPKFTIEGPAAVRAEAGPRKKDDIVAKDAEAAKKLGITNSLYITADGTK